MIETAAHLPASVLGNAALALSRTLPLGALLADVLPAVQRGSTISCTGHAAVGMALAVAAGPSQAGSWTVVAGQPTLGIHAAADAGVELARLVAVPGESFTDQRWGESLAAMVDGFDVIIVGSAVRALRAATARRIQARAQSRGAVLVTIGQHQSISADLQIDSAAVRWTGLGDGHGVALARQVDIEVRGRRMPRPQRTTMQWPSVRLPYVPEPIVPIVEHPPVTALEQSA